MIHKFILGRAECGCITAGIADDGSADAAQFAIDMKRSGRTLEHLTIDGINPGPQLHVCNHEKVSVSFKRRLGHLTRNNRGE